MRYQPIFLAVYALITSLSYFLITNQANIIANLPFITEFHKQHPAIVDAAAAAFIVSTISYLLNTSRDIALLIVEGLPFSRALRQFLSGRHFVEGDWPLIVVQGNDSPEPGKLIYIGIFTIGFKQGELYVKGDDWDENGLHAVSFESVRSRFSSDHNERLLQYFYRQGRGWQDTSMRGYTEINFFPCDAKSDVLAGEFIDKHHSAVRFYAKKKFYKAFERRLKTNEEKKAAAKQVWAEFEKNMPLMIANPICADWR